jgi:hypothetical protein
MLLALTASIRLRWKGLTVTNILTHYEINYDSRNSIVNIPGCQTNMDQEYYKLLTIIRVRLLGIKIITFKLGFLSQNNHISLTSLINFATKLNITTFSILTLSITTSISLSVHYAECRVFIVFCWMLFCWVLWRLVSTLCRFFKFWNSDHHFFIEFNLFVKQLIHIKFVNTFEILLDNSKWFNFPKL